MERLERWLQRRRSEQKLPLIKSALPQLPALSKPAAESGPALSLNHVTRSAAYLFHTFTIGHQRSWGNCWSEDTVIRDGSKWKVLFDLDSIARPDQA